MKGGGRGADVRERDLAANMRIWNMLMILRFYAMASAADAASLVIIIKFVPHAICGRQRQLSGGARKGRKGGGWRHTVAVDVE